jgi:hypothetical protein
MDRGLMPKKQCRSCGGIYVPVQPDGTRYFHVCSPLIELRDKAGLVVTPAEAVVLEKAGQIVTRVELRRPQHRDENIDPAKAAAALDARGARTPGTPDDALIKAPGAGVDELP